MQVCCLVEPCVLRKQEVYGIIEQKLGEVVLELQEGFLT